MAVTRLSPTAEAICLALAHYRFLTVNQMQTLGLASRDTLYKTLRDICERKRALVQCTSFKVTAHGRMPNIYSLRKYGAEAADALGQFSEPVRYPSRDYVGHASAQHNTAVVDCHIMLDQWAAASGATVDFCYRDFDTGTARGIRKTSVKIGEKTIVPDMVFQFTIDGISRLCCLELYCDESSTRVVQSLEKYPPALQAIADHYGYPHGVRVLAVFTKPGLIAPVIRAASNKIREKSQTHFYLSSPERLKRDFRTFWVGLNNTPHKLF